MTRTEFADDVQQYPSDYLGDVLRVLDEEKTTPCRCGVCKKCQMAIASDALRSLNESYMSAEETEMRTLAGMMY